MRGTRKVLALASGGKVMVTVPAPAVEDGQVPAPQRREQRQRPAATAKRSRQDSRWRRTPNSCATGLDLKLELPVTLGEAVLGGKVRVPTLDGAVVLTVPPGREQRHGAQAAPARGSAPRARTAIFW